MNTKKQKHIINNLLNSPDLVGKCIDILEPDYFDPEYIPHVAFLLDYHMKRNANPSVELMNAETDTDDAYDKYMVTTDEFEYCAEEVESFCKQCAMRDAVTESFSLIQNNEFGEVYKRVSDALNVSLKRDMGLDVFADPSGRLKSLLEDLDYLPSGIKVLDDHMKGGSLRKQLHIVSANSGGGKSVFLSNISNNYVLQGQDVLYVSLELPEDMIFLRQAYIMTSFSHHIWKSKIPEIAAKMNSFKKYGAGNFRIIRLPIGSNANSIRAYLKQYELEFGKAPDALIVDYLDLMSPISGIKNKGQSEQDREKSQDLYELLHLYDMHGWSASQQNRDALKMGSPNQSAIAGGMSKVDICDNWFSLFMDENMRAMGDLLGYVLKSRYAGSQGKSFMMGFDDDSLKISDHDNPDKSEDLIKQIERRKEGKKSSTKAEKSVVEQAAAHGDLELPNTELTAHDHRTSARLDTLKREVFADFSDENDISEEDFTQNQLLELCNYSSIIPQGE